MNRVEGRRPVLEALKAGRVIREIVVSSTVRSAPVLDEIGRLADRAAVPMRRVPRDEFDRISATRNPQGVIAIVGDPPTADLGDLIASAGRAALFVALDGVTDVHNAGAIARSAEAAGAHGLVLPARRSAGLTPDVHRASAGALEHLPACVVANLARALDEMKRAGIWIAALDGDGDRSVFDFDLATEPLCLVLGAEGRGVSRLTRERADVTVRIPLAGRIESLNVSAAAAVALFEIVRQRS